MIWILDENLKKETILRKYTMAQFVEKAREIGTVKINAVYCDENMYLLNKNKTYYVLYQQKNSYPLLAKIEKAEKEDDEDADYPNTIVLEGRSMSLLFTKRVINGTLTVSGYLTSAIAHMIDDCFDTDNNTSDRFVNINVSVETSKGSSSGALKTSEKQITGGTLFESISDFLEQGSYVIKFYPVVEELHELSRDYPGMEGQTNISEFKCIVSTGMYLLPGKEGEPLRDPVIISKSLSNVKRTSYNYNTQNDVNVAYVAGEGEDAGRKWYEIQKDTNNIKKAWMREELWIDARDIQSQQDDTALTETEYEELINERASEKFAENETSEEYSATMNTLDKRYVYGVDFEIGDWLSVRDSDLGITLLAQVTEVTTTIQNNQEIVDIGFTYGNLQKDPVKQMNLLQTKVDSADVNIKYLENRTIEIKNILTAPLYYVPPASNVSGNRLKIMSGTIVSISGTSQTSRKMYSIEELRDLLDEPDLHPQEVSVVVNNGDGRATDAHVDGATWIDNVLFAVLGSNYSTGGAIRFNFTLFAIVP